MTVEFTPAHATRSVERALALLGIVAEYGGVSLTEAARDAELATSTALRLLRGLEQTGFVVRSPDGAFFAGPRLLQLGATAVGRSSLIRLAEPALKRIVDQTGESTYLAMAAPGESAVYVAMAEGTYTIRHTSWIGRSVPLDGLAVGEALRGRVPRTGYVVRTSAMEDGVTAIASPIRRSGGVAAAITLLGPEHRLDAATTARFGKVLAAETKVLGEALGVAEQSVEHGQNVQHSTHSDHSQRGQEIG